MDEKDIQRLVDLQQKKQKDKKLSDEEEGELRILFKKYNAGYITRGETADLVNRALQQFEGRIAPFILAFNAIQALLVRYDILTQKEIEDKKKEIIEVAKQRQVAMIEKEKLAREKTAKSIIEKENLEIQTLGKFPDSLKKDESVVKTQSIVEKVAESVVEKQDSQQVISFNKVKSEVDKKEQNDKPIK